MMRTTVMIVTEDGRLADDLREMLVMLGYTVPAAVTAVGEAVAMARQERPDLVLVDAVLAGPLSTSETARLFSEETTVPVIYLATRADAATIKAASAAVQPLGMVHKPVEAWALDITIQCALQRADLEARLTTALQEVSKEKQRVEGVLSAIGDGVMILDNELRIIFQNGALTGMFGYHVGEHCYEACAHLDRVCDQCQAEAAFRDGEVQRSARTFQAPTVELHIEVTASPIRNEQGEITSVVEVIRDVSERERLHGIINTAARGVLVDVGQDFFRSLVGYLATVLQVDYAMVGELADPSRQRLRALAMSAAGRFAEPFVYDLAGTPCEHVFIDGICCYPVGVRNLFPADRKLVEMEVEGYIGVPLLAADGSPLGHIAILSRQPISQAEFAVSVLQIFAVRAAAELQRCRDEELIRQLNRDLERRVAERTTELQASHNEMESFSYSVAHDLRTPLRGINGFSRILLESYAARLDDEGRDLLQRLCRATERMDLLVDGLLKLSHIASQQLHRSTVDLSRLVNRFISEFRERDPERRVIATVTPGVQAAADENLIWIVLANLVGNAWKFTSTRAEARIEFGVREEAGRRVFFLRDNGVGFDMAYVGKLFAPFQRLVGFDEFEGTGIGLVTVKRIILRHGGDIWAEGSLDQGATFCFTLP